MQGAENTADVFTKALGAELLNKLCEKLRATFPEGSDGIALTINTIKTSGIDEGLARILERRCGIEGKCKIWCRNDLRTKVYRTTNKGGPEWQQVERRITVEAETGSIINIEDTSKMTREDEHRLISKDSRTHNIITMLLYRPRRSRGKDDDDENNNTKHTTPPPQRSAAASH